MTVQPERLLHYRIIDKVAEGGMGQVYRAEDTKLGRNVALKLLTPDATRDQSAKRRLLSEAQSASVLNHPNIVTIHAIEEVDGVDFIVMEFVEGETLTAHLANNGALPLPSLLATASEHEVHKYIAVAHNLMARVSVRAGELEAAEKHFDAALNELRDYPAPLVAWRVHAGRARLKSKLGDTAGAEEATARAVEIINLIAGNVKDENLRNTFLSATAAQLKPGHG